MRGTKYAKNRQLKHGIVDPPLGSSPACSPITHIHISSGRGGSVVSSGVALGYPPYKVQFAIVYWRILCWVLLMGPGCVVSMHTISSVQTSIHCRVCFDVERWALQRNGSRFFMTIEVQLSWMLPLYSGAFRILFCWLCHCYFVICIGTQDGPKIAVVLRFCTRLHFWCESRSETRPMSELDCLCQLLHDFPSTSNGCFW